MEALYDFFARPKDPRYYTAVQIGLASSELIRQWSHGEIRKPETINYRTFKPERDGLFCAKIFGPTRDYECNCGKYKRMKHRGVICEKCGVEVIQSRVRRDRMAHIDLSAPVAHIWFLKSLPSKIGNLLDMTLKSMERVLYFDSYIVIDPKDTELTRCQLLTDEKYREALEKYGRGKFEISIGAEAVRTLLENADLPAMRSGLREDIRNTNSVSKRQKLAKRLRIVDAFSRSEINPSWMIMDVIPVLPPDLRPLVPLEGGRFATSDLNDLYRRVINRNNRLRRLTDLHAPDIIVRNEKRMLQESVDVLFDNGRHGRVITGTNKRPLKSLSDTLKGKQGRFRQNLLGKRVDYSGRTVITTGPSLRLHQCGLPKKMALELFKPFVYYRLEHKGLVSTVKSARKMVEREIPEVWDTLEEVVKEYPVLLNRAPTLHRLGFQAFEPTLIEGKAIQLHPLVCTAFNADFDGDQMAVHVPLSVEAQIESRVLMLSSNNILSPANGSPIIVPSQDIVLGIYYMTREIAGVPGEGMLFSGPGEVRSAYDSGKVSLHAGIKVRMQKSSVREISPGSADPGAWERVETTVGRILLWEIIPGNSIMAIRHIRVSDEKKAVEIRGKIVKGADFASTARQSSVRRSSVRQTAPTAADKESDDGGELRIYRDDEFTRNFALRESDAEKVISLSPGEISPVIFADGHWFIFEMVNTRPELPFQIVNSPMDKKSLRELVDYVYRNLGPKATVILSDRLKNTGYQYSTEGGLSISIDAMIVPESKQDILKRAEGQVSEISRQYTEGLITQGEKYNKVVDIWAKATDDVANEMMKAMKSAETSNPIYMMADSGARGSKDQMRQLAGMRGLMAKPSGEIIETPITANFREGLSVLQYFISTHGARKGLADTALKTANSGYLTRRLADVAQDCTVIHHNCETLMGVEVSPLMEGGEVIQRLGERILGRTALEDILNPFTDEPMVYSGDEIDEAAVKRVEDAGLTNVKIRSVLTCKTRHGVCAKCYGRDLAHGQTVEIGQAVGILAAQSIGEPGTQLTMRTFHIGGTASRRVEQADIRARIDGTIKYTDLSAVPVWNPSTPSAPSTSSGTTPSASSSSTSSSSTSSDTAGTPPVGEPAEPPSAYVVMNRRGGEFTIVGETGRELENFPVIYGARVEVKDGQRVKAGDLLASWDPFTTPIISETDGVVKFGDIAPGRTLQEKVDPVTGKSSRTIIEAKSSEVRPRISVKDGSGKTKKVPIEEGRADEEWRPNPSAGSGTGRGEPEKSGGAKTKMARYMLPVDAVLLVEEGDRVKAGDVMAKLPRATTKTKDITGGLPRVAELFEVRKPKETAILSEINGYIAIAKGTKGKQKVTVTPVDAGEKREYLIPRGKHINVYEGDYIKAGEPLIGGAAIPQDILKIKGEVSLARYLVDEVQEVYRLQGVRINDKHIEVIVRQMMRRVKVTDPGDTDFIVEEQADKIRFDVENERVIAEGKKPATAEPLILGITKASLSTDSFISAASFQETTKVLTEASIAKANDPLRGLKENVIMGRLVPAGTGFPEYRHIEVDAG
ncbi:DNA-directed RNA polymerase subunit beta' [Desulfococcaceae bacterium HSG8]|nr:DNA-directed RNA polymerase subunit beta' [Desulfococcaceae bacterium HSG8]